MNTTVMNQGPAGLTWQETYSRIPVASLRVDTVTDFDLYLLPHSDRPPVLYRERNLPFTEETKARLKENAVKELYVHSDQSQAYRRYVEANLKEILDDPEIAVSERTEVLYASASGLVKDVLNDPRRGEILPRSKAMVDNAVGFIFRQKDAVENLLKVTSYDYYTYTHSVNVFVFCIALAKRMGYGETMVLEFGSGALLHDIGKCMVDPAILNCRGKLSPEQWHLMKQHPIYGYNILRRQGVEATGILDVARHHHEKLTGSGYPDGLRGSDLSALVRMSTVADIFDALTTRRPYKDALPSFSALQLMKKERASELDFNVFQAFVEMLGSPMGPA